MRIFLFFLFLLGPAHGKSMLVDTTIPGPALKLWIQLANGKTRAGFVQYSTDSSIYLSQLRYGNGKIIPVEQIEAISYKNGAGFFSRVLIGSLGGFILGFLIGLNSCDDGEDCGIFRSIFGRETAKGAFYQGIVFSGVVGIAAAASGRLTYRIPINKNRNQFKVFRYKSY